MTPLKSAPCLQLFDDVYKIRIVDILGIYEQFVECKLYDDLDKYHCWGKFDKTAQNFLYHHMIYELSEFIIQTHSNFKNYNLIFYFNENDIERLNILNSIDINVFKKNFIKLIENIKKYLPIKIFNSSYTFNHFLNLDKFDGTFIEIRALIRLFLNENFDDYSYKNIKKFTIKYNLKFLSETYFNSIKTKQLIFLQ